MQSDRKQHTTELIRSAALAEFTRVGPRFLSLSNVAKRAYVSTGAVYQRWSNRRDCIHDIVNTYVPLAVDTLSHEWRDSELSVDQIVNAQLQDPDGLERLRFLAEAVFAAREDPSLEDLVTASLRRWRLVMEERIPGAKDLPVITWWVISTWLGCALLRTSGQVIPDTFDRHVADILRCYDTFTSGADPTTPRTLSRHDFRSHVNEPAPVDQTSTALVEATRQVIADRGADAADLRSVAREAGVTTGAVYRRFSSRSELLIRAFVAGLGPERYAWTLDFLAVLDDQGLEGAGDYWAQLCRRIWEDTEQAHLLLEFTIAAHDDERILTSVLTEIGSVAENRQFLFASLIDAGIVHDRHSAEGLAWTLQVPPVGMRLLASIGITPNGEELAFLLRGYFLLLVSDA